MYKEDLALNNLQWLICHKTKPNPIDVIVSEFEIQSHYHVQYWTNGRGKGMNLPIPRKL